jgi:peptidoglycan-associated lipoprotein
MQTLSRKLFRFIAIGGLAILAACDHEAGQNVDEGGFGTPTEINQLAMTGQATLALQRRFAAEVPTTVTFPFNESTITPEAAAVLTRQASWILQFPEVRFKVYGYADKVGSNGYNYNLGLRRARAVVAYFGSLGISRSRLQAVVSYGETQPVVLTEGPEQRNRRTVTEVTGFVKGSSGPLDGKYADIIYREYIESATRPISPPSTTNTEVNPGN